MFVFDNNDAQVSFESQPISLKAKMIPNNGHGHVSQRVLYELEMASRTRFLL